MINPRVYHPGERIVFVASGLDRGRRPWHPFRWMRLAWLRTDRRVRRVPAEHWVMVVAMALALLFLYLLIHDPYFHAGK